LDNEQKKKITLEDLDNALQRLNTFRKNKDEEIPEYVKHLYI
jgi:hypothetical protein